MGEEYRGNKTKIFVLNTFAGSKRSRIGRNVVMKPSGRIVLSGSICEKSALKNFYVSTSCLYIKAGRINFKCPIL